LSREISRGACKLVRKLTDIKKKVILINVKLMARTLSLSLLLIFSMLPLIPYQVRELAEKEPEDGVFKMLRTDVTRFLTTILIGTT